MQVMLTQIDDHEAIHILLKHLVDTDKDVRRQLISNQIADTIAIRWIESMHDRRKWDVPTKCVARFHEDGTAFTASAQVDYGTGLEDYVKRIKSAVSAMMDEVCMHDLDKVVFDIDHGREAICIAESTVEDGHDGQGN